MAQQESRLLERRGAAAIGPLARAPATTWCSPDRVIATLVILRFQLPHAALALFYGVDRSTITRAVHEIRPLLAARGSPSPETLACGCARWLMCSPTPPPRA
jgi:Helix-turn-helix of DDE superfamily endonuclease